MSLESSFCRKCECRSDIKTCRLCLISKYQCTGTCRCCRDYGQEDMSLSNAAKARRQEKAECCTYCFCFSNFKTCKKCIYEVFPCPGTCKCCEHARNLILQGEKSHETDARFSIKKREFLADVNQNVSAGKDETNLSPASSHSHSAPAREFLNSNTSSTKVVTEMVRNEKQAGYCSRCNCIDKHFSCFECATGKYSCPGICACCEEYRMKIQRRESRVVRLSAAKIDVLKEVTNQNVLPKKGQLSSQSSPVISRAKDLIVSERQEPTYVRHLTDKREVVEKVTYLTILTEDELTNLPSSAISTTENLIPNSSSSIESDTHIKVASKGYCSQCECEGMGSPPCRICKSSKYKCSGTCSCCAGHGTESQVAEFFRDEEICPRCNCIKGRDPCNNCCIWEFKCPGDCPCCVKHRVNVLLSSSSNPSEIIDPTFDCYYCPRCRCEKGRGPCYECQSCNFRCLGVCGCCLFKRLKRSTSSIERDIHNENIERYRRRCRHELDEGTCIECLYTSSVRSSFINIWDVPKELRISGREKPRGLCLSVTMKNNEKMEFELNKNTIGRMSEDVSKLERSTSLPERNVLSPDRIIDQDSLLSSGWIYNMKEGSNYCSEISTPLYLDSNTIQQSPVRHDEYGTAVYLNNSKQSTKSPCTFSQSELEQSSVNCIYDNEEYYCFHCECVRGKEPCGTCRRIDMECIGICKCCERFNSIVLELDEVTNLQLPFQNIEEKSSSKNFTFGSHSSEEAKPVETTKKRSTIKSTRQVMKDNFKGTSEATKRSKRIKDRKEDYSQILQCLGCKCIKNRESCLDCRALNLKCLFPTSAKYCTCCECYD